MTDRGGPTPAFRPSAALVRTVALATLATILALTLHRPALVVLAAPFVVWAVAGVLRRPRVDEGAPTVTVSARAIALGEAVAVRAQAAAPERIVEIVASSGTGADADPAAGAATGREETAVRLRPRRWGRWDLDAVWVTVSDSWGLWVSTWRSPVGSVDVSPIATVPGRGDAIPHPTGTAGIHRSRRPGDGVDLSDIRRYQAGDRLNRINWRVTSRTGALHTNATTADRDTDVLIVVDTLVDATTAGLSGPEQSSLDDTVVAAASLVEHYLRLGDRVGVHDLGDTIGPLPARSGIRQLTALTTRLGRVRLGVPRDPRLHRVQRLRPGTFVVVCTPLLSDGVRDEIATLAQRGGSVLVVDTLPSRLGRIEPGPADHRSRLREIIDPTPSFSLWEEAWALRRMERERDVQRLRALGIPVTAWGGVSGVAGLAAALATQRPRARAAGSAR